MLQVQVIAEFRGGLSEQAFERPVELCERLQADYRRQTAKIDYQSCTTRFSSAPPCSKSVMLATVVAAIFWSASRVKNA